MHSKILKLLLPILVLTVVIIFLSLGYKEKLPSPECNDTFPFNQQNSSCWYQRIAEIKTHKIAVIKPVFTTSAYMSFYTFYRKYANVPLNHSVRTDLNLLTTKVYDGWGASESLYHFIKSQVAKEAGIILGKNTFILTDIDLDQARLFSENGSLLYDVVILGFEEYVTAKEYYSLKKFVLSGGKLIILSGVSFLAEVKYDPVNNTISLVKGHGWYFNGTVAIKSVYHRWYSENTEWVGSNYAYYVESHHYNVQGALANTSNPYSVLLRLSYGEKLLINYSGHEENVLTNKSASIIVYWILSGIKEPKGVVATYELHVGKGVVFHFGIFGTDILLQSKQLQFLLLSILGLYSIDAYVYHYGCETKVVGIIKSEFSSLNKRWIAKLEVNNEYYDMNSLNIFTFTYATSDCSLNSEKLRIFIYSPDFAGSYAEL